MWGIEGLGVVVRSVSLLNSNEAWVHVRVTPGDDPRPARYEVDTAYRDRDCWAQMAALNTARSGWFSSDRTIRGYAGDIWDAAPVPDAMAAE